MDFFLERSEVSCCDWAPFSSCSYQNCSGAKNHRQDIGSRSAQIARAQRGCCCCRCELQPFLCLKWEKQGCYCSMLTSQTSGSQTVVHVLLEILRLLLYAILLFCNVEVILSMFCSHLSQSMQSTSVMVWICFDLGLYHSCWYWKLIFSQMVLGVRSLRTTELDNTKKQSMQFSVYYVQYYIVVLSQYTESEIFQPLTRLSAV